VSRGEAAQVRALLRTATSVEDKVTLYEIVLRHAWAVLYGIGLHQQRERAARAAAANRPSLTVPVTVPVTMPVTEASVPVKHVDFVTNDRGAITGMIVKDARLGPYFENGTNNGNGTHGE
jgi:hypothetical protein